LPCFIAAKAFHFVNASRRLRSERIRIQADQPRTATADQLVREHPAPRYGGLKMRGRHVALSDRIDHCTKMQTSWVVRVLGLGSFGLLGISSALAQGCAAPNKAAGRPPTSINPVIVRPLQTTLTAVPATDGLVHLAYAAQVTNLVAGVAEIESITPVDAGAGFTATGANLVVDLEDHPITGKVRVFGLPPDAPCDSATLAAGVSGVTFFDVTYPSLAAVPHLLAHRVSVRLPAGVHLATLTDPLPIACAPPVRLSPPLSGHGWWNGNGCCRTVGPHRSATLPLNGDLRVPEQFAVDLVQVSPAGLCCTGPVKALQSWPFYGVPVLAAAAGTVVEATDGQPDQVPGPAEGVTVTNAAGNHVIQSIGGGRWVLYAHLRPGTVTVHTGDKLRPGQPVGELGNSGSSTAPHLHFQVMDHPSALTSIGLPFVFDRQMREGTVRSTPAQAELDYEAGRAIKVDRTGAGPRRDEMPAEGQVFGFRVE